MNITWQFLVIILCMTARTGAIFCYTCKQLPNENTRCNENEPMKCGPHQQRCGMHNTSTLLRKGCVERCPPPSRGDSSDKGWPCLDCEDDLCNLHVAGSTPGNLLESVELVSRPYVFTLFWHSTTYWEARLTCTKRSGTLATIHNAQVQRFLENNLAKITSPLTGGDVINGLWMGSRSIDQITWIWTDDGMSVPIGGGDDQCSNDTKKYQNWGAGQPVTTLSSDRKQCGLFRIEPVGEWEGSSCGGMAAGYLCQSRVYKRGADEVDFIQSIVYDSRVFTYHATLANISTARDACALTGGKLANLDDEATRVFVPSQLSFAINGDFWSEKMCEKKRTPSNSVTCSTELPFICEKAFTKRDCHNVPQPIREPNTLPMTSLTTASDTSSQSLTSSTLPPTSATTIDLQQDDVTTRSYCTSQTIAHMGNPLSFPNTSYKSFATSEEKCQSGRPLASIFCDRRDGVIQYDVTTLAITSCTQTLSALLEETATTPPKASGTKSQVSSLTSEIRLLTSQASTLTTDNITDTIELLRSVEKMTNKSGGNASNAIVTSQTLTNIIATASSVQSSIATSKTGYNENKNEVASLVETFVARVSLDENMPTYELRTNEIQVQTTVFSDNLADATHDVTFTGSTFRNREDNSRTPYISIKTGALQEILEQQTNNHSKQIRAVFVGYTDSTLFQSEEGTTEKVITATILNGADEEISVPVSFAFEKSNRTNDCLVEKCSYYDASKHSWSTDGCAPSTGEHNHMTYCACEHTTSFAVVVSYKDGEENIALDITSQVGLALCVLCLLVTVILFVCLPDLKRVRSANIHANLCLCLMLAYLVFLLGVERTSVRPLCVAIAAFIHYFLLAAWGWMAVESITMFRMFISSFDRNGVKGDHKMAITVYVVSGLVVISTICGVVIEWNINKDSEKNPDCQGTDLWDGYIGESFCWLTGPALYFGFMTIVGIILIANVIIAFLVIRAITWGRRKMQSSIDESPTVQVLRAVLVALLMGVSWVFAIPVAISRNHDVTLVFAWIFAISTSVQGMFMFYFFCLRRAEVRHAWIGPICAVLCCNNRRRRHNKEETTGDEGDSTSGGSAVFCMRRWRAFTHKRAHKHSSVVTEMTARG